METQSTAQWDITLHLSGWLLRKTDGRQKSVNEVLEKYPSTLCGNVNWYKYGKYYKSCLNNLKLAVNRTMCSI